MPSTPSPAITLRDVTFEWPDGATALAGLAGTLGTGRTGLVGDNGAGKSTLVKAIAGVQLCDEGTFYFRGEMVKISSPQDATALGIATVYQDLALCDNLDVVANLYLGREVFAKGAARAAFLLDETAMEQSALQLLDSLAQPVPGTPEIPTSD